MRHPDLLRTLARAAALAVPIVLAACASKPIEPPAPAPAPVAVAAPAPTVQAAAPAPVPAPMATLAEYLDPNNPISSKRSLYFGFDDATFNAADKPVVELQGAYLAGHADLHVRVEGNTDERGGAEYNLALGQRRAQDVKSALEIYGVKDDQVEAVSFGEEKPKATGHDEQAWQENRRADIVYPMH